MSIPGRGLFTTPPDTRITTLPTCPNCRQVAPDCQCGKPAPRPSS